MKSLVVLFAGEISGYALEPLAGGLSAFNRSLAAAFLFPDAARVLVLAGPKTASRIGAVTEKEGASLVKKDVWTQNVFFSCISSESEGFDHVFIVRATTPCIDPVFSSSLYKKHLKYAAEYTFADGYPAGLAPEILARGILPVLAKLSESCSSPVTASTVFDTVKKDINSFDIETDIAPVDLRHLRLDFACESKRSFTLCSSFTDITAENYGDLVRARASSLRTIPSFYAIQVSGRCPSACAFCPYPAFSESGKGSSPGTGVTGRSDFMSTESFSLLAEKIASFSDDAVVSLSLWGECACHPDIVRLVSEVLSRPSLSVLIETTGLGWSPSSLEGIAAAAAAAPARTNGQNAINWIVSLDAAGSGVYSKLHGFSPAAGDSALREALSVTESLMRLFPGCVWPQIVRMKENEIELETFYRFWKEKAGQVIVQKHDHFCGTITDRRVADLSPLSRAPCWHIKRDMCILIDGSVSACREDLYATRPCGNAFTDSLESIWEKAGTLYEQHAGCEYKGMCEACDEYYTFNF